MYLSAQLQGGVNRTSLPSAAAEKKDVTPVVSELQVSEFIANIGAELNMAAEDDVFSRSQMRTATGRASRRGKSDVLFDGKGLALPSLETKTKTRMTRRRLQTFVPLSFIIHSQLPVDDRTGAHGVGPCTTATITSSHFAIL